VLVEEGPAVKRSRANVKIEVVHRAGTVFEADFRVRNVFTKHRRESVFVDHMERGVFELSRGASRRLYPYEVVTVSTPLRIAIGSDDLNATTEALLAELEVRGVELLKFGAFDYDADRRWSAIGLTVAECLAQGLADQGIVMCWTGTGVSIAANKVEGVRAALCVDAATATGARRWNDANVLALSLRLTTPALLSEILAAWFKGTPSDDQESRNCRDLLRSL
jgi:RpiB/LacA/LacB family sugar-phosphate isomerase